MTNEATTEARLQREARETYLGRLGNPEHVNVATDRRFWS